MRISDWSSDVCSSDLCPRQRESAACSRWRRGEESDRRARPAGEPRRVKRPFILLGAAMLAGCGLKPMYAGGGSGEVARGLADIQVAAIEGRAGWLVRNALVDPLGGGQTAPRYRLDEPARPSGTERVWQYVSIRGVGVTLKKK